jgi:hypothetical protein
MDSESGQGTSADYGYNGSLHGHPLNNLSSEKVQFEHGLDARESN